MGQVSVSLSRGSLLSTLDNLLIYKGFKLYYGGIETIEIPKVNLPIMKFKLYYGGIETFITE